MWMLGGYWSWITTAMCPCPLLHIYNFIMWRNNNLNLFFILSRYFIRMFFSVLGIQVNSVFRSLITMLVFWVNLIEHCWVALESTSCRMYTRIPQITGRCIQIVLICNSHDREYVYLVDYRLIAW
jgi:hypothetical protein